MPTTAVLGAPYGRSQWHNVEDNWRKEDVDWLQDRTVLRYASSIGDTLQQGQVVYQASTDSIRFQGADALKSVLSSAKAATSDFGNEAVFLNTVAGAGGFTLRSDGTVNFPTKATFGPAATTRVELDSTAFSGRVTIVNNNPGQGAYTLMVQNSRLEANGPSGTFFSPTMYSNSLNVPAGGTLSVLGGATFGGSTTMAAVTLASITVSGGGTISSPSGLISSLSMQATNYFIASGGSIVPAGASNQKIKFNGGTGSDVVITSTNGPRFEVGANSAPIAGYNVSTLTPIDGGTNNPNWPNGTIWLTVV